MEKKFVKHALVSAVSVALLAVSANAAAGVVSLSSATASDTSGSYVAANAIDGSSSTRWEATSTTSSLTIKFASCQKVDDITIDWYGTTVYSHKLELSTDSGKTWTTVSTNTGSGVYVKNITDQAANALRIVGNGTRPRIDEVSVNSTGSATCSSTTVATSTPTATTKPTSTPTATAKATSTPTATTKATSTPTATTKPTSTPTATAKVTSTPTATTKATSTPTATTKPTSTPTATPTATIKPTSTPTPTTASTSSVPAGTPGLRTSSGSAHATHVPNVASNVINVVTRAAALGKTINLADNSTSDQAAIEAVLADASTVSGSTVYFPNGTYNIANLSLTKSGVNIVGESRDGTIIKSTLSGTGTAFNISGLNNIVVQNLTLTSSWSGSYSTDTSNTSSSAGGPYYMLATGNNAYNITIDNVVTEKFYKMGFRIAAGSHDIVLKNSIVRNATDVAGGGAGYGISIQGSTHSTASYNPFLGDATKDTYYVTVANNTVTGPYIRHGILLQYWAHNNLITNNTISQTQLDSIDLHGEDEYANEISYNTVSKSQRAAIALGNTGAGHDKSGTYNWIHHNDLVGNNWGVTIQYGSDYTTIENNTIRDNSSLAASSPVGVLLGKSAYSSLKNNVISNNTVSGFIGVYLVDDAAEGEEAAGGPNNWTIQGNTVTNSGTAFKDAASLDSGNIIQNW